MSGSYGENARRKPHTPSAIVIGGGFAGLAAADALRNASFQVIFGVIFLSCFGVGVMLEPVFLWRK
jgi:NAD(P)H-nitrite reductase large subunit